jgi:hypothetical protein
LTGGRLERFVRAGRDLSRLALSLNCERRWGERCEGEYADASALTRAL